MQNKYDIELSEPSASRCDCCGGLTVRLTRFVYRAGDAFAIYYAAYSNNHPDSELAMLVSLGEWGEGSDPSQRTAFYCRVFPTKDSYEVMLGDATQSAWRDVAIIGERLSREEALRHPWKATAFEVLDEAFLQDRSLRGFLHRVQCGDASVPLERSFQAPDDIFALGDQVTGRTELRRNFASLDGKRFFVRCLLPVPVEDYGTWSVGLWIEVSKPDYDHIEESWDDPLSYPNLRFGGMVANDLGADLGLPVRAGCKVQLHVPAPDSPPRVLAPATGDLAALLSNAWTKPAFEAYAVARGFL
ncbi:MAG: DUF2199 domain-containing protein [Labilithrix sp.]|nr:DUF2199 domain-containing protein [Labilithrix sp.]